MYVYRYVYLYIHTYILYSEANYLIIFSEITPVCDDDVYLKRL
jgi:hypothetical protein